MLVLGDLFLDPFDDLFGASKTNKNAKHDPNTHAPLFEKFFSLPSIFAVEVSRFWLLAYKLQKVGHGSPKFPKMKHKLIKRELSGLVVSELWKSKFRQYFTAFGLVSKLWGGKRRTTTKTHNQYGKKEPHKNIELQKI